MNDEQWIATMKGQALAASDSFDVGATIDPDVILASNAKHHILWLIEKLRDTQDELAKWRRTAYTLAMRMAYYADCPDHDAPNPDCPFCQDVDAYPALRPSRQRGTPVSNHEVVDGSTWPTCWPTETGDSDANPDQ